MQTIKFRTEYTPVRENFTLNPEKPVLLMGSCFADNISQRMQFCRWNACNPFGVLFNPLSIARVLRMSLSGLYADIPDSIFGNEGIFHSWLSIQNQARLPMRSLTGLQNLSQHSTAS